MRAVTEGFGQVPFWGWAPGIDDHFHLTKEKRTHHHAYGFQTKKSSSLAEINEAISN